MPNKTLISNFSTMKDNNTLTYDTHSISTVFKSFFSNLARYLHTILPNPQDKYNLESDINYSRFTLTDDFCLNKTSENKVIKIIQKIEISMATGIDRLSGHFLQDEAGFLSRPISEICNLSISHGVFLDASKDVKLKTNCQPLILLCLL